MPKKSKKYSKPKKRKSNTKKVSAPLIAFPTEIKRTLKRRKLGQISEHQPSRKPIVVSFDPSHYLGLGIAFGIAVGIMFGGVFNNYFFGIILGLFLGILIGLVCEKYYD